MQPFRMLPPLSQVLVMGILSDVGIVTRVPRPEVGIRSLTIPLKSVGMVRVSDNEGVSTPTLAPIVTEAARVADTLRPSGLLGTSVVKPDKPGKFESRDEAPSKTAPGT